MPGGRPMKRAVSLALSICMVSGLFFAVCDQPAMAKKWTVSERIERLSKEIDKGKESGELTTKQIESLNKQMGKVKAKIEKMKASNEGKLSYPDVSKLHKELNGISARIHKQRLDNVYAN